MSSPEEVAASCDITFAMLADPESAVRMSLFSEFCLIYWLQVNMLVVLFRWMLLVEKMGLQME